MKKEHKLFFAIPFDSATRNQYERIVKRLRKRYPALTTVIGSNEVGPSLQHSQIATFKAQNRELHQQFTKQITDADIVIADLTHNNPNVHVELGIALMQNKNILRVTGRSVADAPFDVRQLDIAAYKDEAGLVRTITAYLDTFLKIKGLPLQSDKSPFYRKLVQNEKMNAMSPGDRTDILDPSPDLLMRDGGIRARFSIVQSATQSDWFGICFRVGDATPWTGCHMVYVRRDGSIELATYPGPQVAKLAVAPILEGEQDLTIDFENDFLGIRMGETEVDAATLTYQRAGRVVLAAHQSEVTIASAEIICRDTIEWDVR